MSTGRKQSLGYAQRDAALFRDLFTLKGYQYWERWEIAGSVRRGKPEVGDIEHVVMPKFGKQGNELWMLLDSMLPDDGIEAAGIVEKAVYPNGTNRWGEKYRGVMFRGFRHEVFIADAMNWGNRSRFRKAA